MTDIETGTIMDILETAYPQSYKNQTNERRLASADLWSAMFADDDLEIVAAAVKTYIVTEEKGFPPSIGQIKNKIADIKKPDEMAEYEAWNLVKKAIGNGIYGSKEEFTKLPSVLQRLVGSPNKLREWAQMESDILESVVASNFMRSYRTRAASMREFDMLPGDVKEVISAFSERMKLPEPAAALTDADLNDRRNEIRRQLEMAK